MAVLLFVCLQPFCCTLGRCMCLGTTTTDNSAKETPKTGKGPRLCTCIYHLNLMKFSFYVHLYIHVHIQVCCVALPCLFVFHLSFMYHVPCTCIYMYMYMYVSCHLHSGHPVRVSLPGPAQHVACGDNHTVVLLQSGRGTSSSHTKYMYMYMYILFPSSCLWWNISLCTCIYSRPL